jgi:hypothetical protein
MRLNLSVILILISFPLICEAEENALTFSPTSSEERQISDFVGPYSVRFNDKSLDYDQDDIKANNCFTGKINSLLDAYSFIIYNEIWDNKLMIVIEEDLGGAEDYLLENDNASIKFTPASDCSIVEKHQRRIAGYGGTVKIAQNDTGHTIRYGTFRLRSKTSCDDKTKGKLALVQISCLDYSEDEFDRILDTFEIKRYVEPINKGSDP